MAYKLRISKPGYNVLTETNLDYIVYDSNYDTLKYQVSGTVTLSVSGSDTETYINHNLGYVPFFVVYVRDPVFTSRYAMTPYIFQDPYVYSFLCAYADSNRIYFTVHTNSLTANVVFLYKVFRNNTGL